MIVNQWYAIVPSRQVPKNGKIALRRLNLDLVLFRGDDGKIACVADRCAHRGAALSSGKVRDNCICCPFHALAFNGEGKCTRIPANGRAATEDLNRFHVQAYPVRETDGIVFLWYGEASQATDTLPYFSDMLRGFVFSEMEDRWHTHYSRAIENQLDVVHVPIVHHNTIGRGNRTLVNGPKVVLENGDLITSANNETDHGQKPKKPEACVIKETYLRFRFPNLWMNHINDRICIVAYFAPVDAENTVLYIRLYNRITGVRALNRLIAWIGKYMNRVIERQDKRVVITQEPKASAYRSSEHLLVGDGPIIAYRRLREQKISESRDLHP